MTRKVISSEKAPTIGPYSRAVDANGLIFLSGQTPIDPNTGKLVEGGIGEQTEQCFKNLFEVLSAAGLTADDVQKVNVYLTNMDDFAQMNAMYQKQFAQPYPARTTIGVAALPLNAKIEIEMVAKSRK